MTHTTAQPAGLKFDAEKPDFSLVPWPAMREVVEVLTFGERKYNPEGDNPANWRHVPEWDRRYFSAAMRHLLSWTEGDVLDTETGCNHLAHAACCILFMLAKDIEHNDADAEQAPTLEHEEAQMIGLSIELALSNPAFIRQHLEANNDEHSSTAA